MLKKSEEGAVIVEAVISLSAFMFAIATLYCIYFPCVAQAKIGTALNNTAKEISEYSYIYGLTGLNDSQADISMGGGAADSTIKSSLDGAKDLFSTLEGIGEIADDVMVNGDSYVNYLLDNFIDMAKGAAVGELSKVLMKKNFGSDPDGFLRGLGIEDGMSGLNMNKTRVFKSGRSDDITLVCKYEVKVVQFFNIDVTYKFEQCATTKAWFNGV